MTDIYAMKGAIPLTPSLNRRKANMAIETVYERMGGHDEFTNWAIANPTEFYTKLFAKTIERSSEVKTTSIEMYIEQLDALETERPMRFVNEPAPIESHVVETTDEDDA